MNILYLQLVALIVGSAIVLFEIFQYRRYGKKPGIISWLLAIWAIVNILFIAFLWINHINFPLNLNALEATILQHVQRFAALEYIYIEPNETFVPFAYNPLYYVISFPFVRIFGENLFTLRFISISGVFGSGLLIYLIVRKHTNSSWWGLMAVGLFAAAYSAMDASLDTAHADAWLLFSILLGSYIIDNNRSKPFIFIGIFILVASFWFKQHGALFVIGGLFFLTWRDGIKSSILYWMEAVILGPGIYFFGGNQLFGPRFLYFTWEVPRGWTQVSINTFRRYIGIVAKNYPFLAISSGLLAIWTVVKKPANLNVWHFQFAAAILSGLLGSLDPGSSNNVFIPAGTFFILIGVLGINQLAVSIVRAGDFRVPEILLLVSFVIFLYDPKTVIVSAQAHKNYAEFVEMLGGIDGEVYAPIIGQLPDGYLFYPSAHWVALEDLIRGPGKETANNPTIRQLLGPLTNREKPTYILHNFPLEIDQMLGFLLEDYVLEKDLGAKFEPIGVLPGRYAEFTAWPRYLYRYVPGGEE